jgi:hypothetical protein
MSAHCNNILLTLLVLLFGSLPPLVAASLRWVHLGTINAGQVNMAIDGKIAYRKIQPGNSTSWGNIPPGLRRFQIGSRTNPGTSFELEITGGQKIVIVSVSDKNGDIQSRTVVLNAPQGEVFILNTMHGSMMGLPEAKQKAIFGKGFAIPISKKKVTVSFSDSEGLRGEVDFSRVGDAPQSSYLAILTGDDDGKPHLAILRDHDSFFEIGDESIEIPNELIAAVRVVSERTTLVKGGFDPMQVKWDEVDSQIFWLNLMIGRDPCRLEIGGFPAMRRMPSGRGSGFVKWPPGGWDASVVVELTNEKLDAGNFALSSKSSIGLISSGGDKHPARLIILEGRSREKTATPAKPQIRFVNALPDGVLRSVIPYDPEPLTFTMKPGGISEVVPLSSGGFPGAALDFTLGNAKPQKINKIPSMPSIPPGDWVVIIHLDQESFTAPVLTWVEMNNGSITPPGSAEGDGE